MTAALVVLSACGEKEVPLVVVPEPVVDAPVEVVTPEPDVDPIVEPEPELRTPELSTPEPYTYEVTPQNRSALYGEALEAFKAGDIADAYPKFLAVADNGLHAANVYLGLIEARPGAFNNPRGSLSRHYQALEDTGHASSIVVLARALKAGDLVREDREGAAQYYQRLLSIETLGEALKEEARDYLDGLSSAEVLGVGRREGAVTGLSVRNSNLADMVAATVEATGGFKAPGTESLAERG